MSKCKFSAIFYQRHQRHRHSCTFEVDSSTTIFNRILWYVCSSAYICNYFYQHTDYRVNGEYDFATNSIFFERNKFAAKSYPHHMRWWRLHLSYCVNIDINVATHALLLAFDIFLFVHQQDTRTIQRWSKRVLISTEIVNMNMKDIPESTSVIYHGYCFCLLINRIMIHRDNHKFLIYSFSLVRTERLCAFAYDISS